MRIAFCEQYDALFARFKLNVLPLSAKHVTEAALLLGAARNKEWLSFRPFPSFRPVVIQNGAKNLIACAPAFFFLKRTRMEVDKIPNANYNKEKTREETT